MRDPMVNAKTPREAGFTLIELMIAMTLAAIMVGMITVVSISAQKLYDETTARVEVLQNVRLGVNDITNTLERAVLSSDMEFFIDKPGGRAQQLNGHWDDGEELRDSPTIRNLEGGRPNFYDEGAHITERYYLCTDSLTKHANFSIYFKASTEVNGEIRQANVEYYLADPRVKDDDGLYERIGEEIEKNTNLVLVRVVRWIEVNRDNYRSDEILVKRKVSQICQNITDLRFDYLLEGEGRGSASGFVTPSQEHKKARGKGKRALVLGSDVYMKEFLYGRYRRGPEISEYSGQLIRGNRIADEGKVDPPYFELPKDENCPALGIGDSIYVFAQNTGSQFPDGNYTVRNRAGLKVYFEETIDTSEWKSSETGLKFKAGYLPSAIRVAVRVLNDEGQQPRRLAQVAHLRADR